MPNMEILDVAKQLEDAATDDTKHAISHIVDELRQNHFVNVLDKIAELRDHYHLDETLNKHLQWAASLCHAQLAEYEKAAAINRQLFSEADLHDAQELLLLSELAFMSDYKLARRIATAAVKELEDEDYSNRRELARGYLVLGEAEENLEKYPRAAKYYRKALDCFQTNDKRENQMITFLHFKIGMIYAAIGKKDEAVAFHQKVVQSAEAGNQRKLRIHSLISIGKIYGSKEDNEAAANYLRQALEVIEGSALQDTFVHAEALTEMAFYYFDQALLDEALPLYEQAINIYEKNESTQKRKLGMVYMQCAYCLEHKKHADIARAGNMYEKAIIALEQGEDMELFENALADVISFFDQHYPKKKRKYENQFVALTKKMQGL
ncbi:tetratricopeptide repeat protein [Virgibacillus sp. 179-BFC.A HS]|uniref:Tetratricopeptide repeat protein n=1 Tax=Tigheibacillus jepli TaxID=3035914 RepID=A0ABU5CKQ4_9BACI|nr:tetratricopeptide repeat protein [Virgibacillus sp. 179-BFC.A HS]MDY0406060.1 tetratricopeptide repeat protein [Virgibacillus sp. 179-BFC.A HS]